MPDKIVSVLHVEDDMIDARLLRTIFAKHKILNPLYRAADRVEALEMLRGENGRQRLERPYVILLDMKMPRMDGSEFLRLLRADPELKDSDVFMLATFVRDEENAAADQHTVTGHLDKSDLGEDGSRLVELLQEYWHVMDVPPNSQ